MNKKIILLLIIFPALGLGLIYGKKIYNKPTVSPPEVKQTTRVSANEAPKIVSTNPDPLEDNIVSSTQTIEITFNRSLENVGEFKLRIEPKTNIKTELSGDRKTARIIPVKPFELGTTYTIFIGPESKFDGIGNWGQEKIFHFRTIKYTGV